MSDIHELSIHIGTAQKEEKWIDKFIIKGELEYDDHPADPACGLFVGYYKLTRFKIKEITDNRTLRLYYPFTFPIDFMVKLQDRLLERIKKEDKWHNVLATNELSFYQ